MPRDFCEITRKRSFQAGIVSDRQADACSTENALHTRWAFDVTPGRERHVALQLQELGCTGVERPTTSAGSSCMPRRFEHGTASRPSASSS